MTFQAFNNLDDMFTAMREAEEEANANTTDAQRAITWGDHWFSPHPDIGLTVFGEIYASLDALAEEERKHGAEEDEISDMIERETGSFTRGYRFGTAYSPACPEGELGSTHVSTMAKISEQEFELARLMNWDGEKWMVLVKVLREMGW